jgi:predicted transcriptional regulator of viral defense system
MAEKQSSLGPLGTKFFSLMQVRRQTLVRLGELQNPLGLTPDQEHSLLKRLANNGYLLRLKKGIYLIPKQLTPGGAWRPNDYYIIDQFMSVMGAHYYIGGFSAIYYHGLIQQVPNQFVVYNDKYSGKRNFGQLAVSFIKVKSEQIIGFTTVDIRNNNTVNIATLAKTLLDLIQDWSRYQMLEEAYGWIKSYSKNDKILKELIHLTANYGNKNTIRRIGYYLEKIGVDSRKLTSLIKQLTPIKSYVPSFSYSGIKGKKNKKWQVIDNA